MSVSEVATAVFIAVGGLAGIIGCVAAVLYVILSKTIEAQFGKALEKLRHDNSLTLQSEKSRFDLYERRLLIFTSIFDYYEAIIGWSGTPEQNAARTRFFRAYQESYFLFSPESEVSEILKTLLDGGTRVIGFKEHGSQYASADPKGYVEQFNETTRIQLQVFEQGLSRLRAAMKPYLEFN